MAAVLRAARTTSARSSEKRSGSLAAIISSQRVRAGWEATCGTVRYRCGQRRKKEGERLQAHSLCLLPDCAERRSRKEEIAFAQSYFALHTRKQEQNNESVRDVLGQRGIKPEELPPEEDVKKLERRVVGEGRALEEEAKGFPVGVGPMRGDVDERPDS